MECVIRSATVADASGIASVQVQSWRTTYAGIVPEAFLTGIELEAWTEAWIARLSAGTLLLFVAEDAAGIFGFVCGGALREAVGDYDGELYAIYLLEDRQRRGVGRALTRTLVDHLKTTGYKSMLVWVLERNQALAFYRALGAEQVADKMVEIGGASLAEVALGWADLGEVHV